MISWHFNISNIVTLPNPIVVVLVDKEFACECKWQNSHDPFWKMVLAISASQMCTSVKSGAILEWFLVKYKVLEGKAQFV